RDDLVTGVQTCALPISLITLFIFTAAFAAAAEYAWWAPQRRTRQGVAQRLRGLRVEGGRQQASLLRQQHFSTSFFSRFEVMHSQIGRASCRERGEGCGR